MLTLEEGEKLEIELRASHMLGKCYTTEWFCLFMCLYLRQGLLKLCGLATPASGSGGLDYSLSLILAVLVGVYPCEEIP